MAAWISPEIRIPGGREGSVDVLLIEDLSMQRLPARSMAAVFERAGLRTKIVNFASDVEPAHIMNLARDAQPRLIVLSVLFADCLELYPDLVSALRSACFGSHITMVGHLPSLVPAQLLQMCPGLDSVLCGEPNDIIADLAACSLDRAEWQRLAGISYRSSVTNYEALTPGPFCFEEKPFPLRSDRFPTFSGYGFATVESSRGCYHECAFCLSQAFHRKFPPRYKLRPIRNLADEIEELHRDGVRLFMFDDEQFLPPAPLRARRVEEFAQELEQRGLRIAFTIKCRADDVEASLFARLKQSGLVRVYIGIESGCQPSLDLFGKGVTVSRNVEALTCVEELGIVADFRTLMFHPWSTLETIKQDIEFLARVLPRVPTCFNFRELELFPGTDLAAGFIHDRGAGSSVLPLPYSIEDRKAEILRRLARLIFGFESIHCRLQETLTRAWFQVLLQERFEPGDSPSSRRVTLKTEAERANRIALEVWGDILNIAQGCDLESPEIVNGLAERCVRRVNAAIISSSLQL